MSTFTPEIDAAIEELRVWRSDLPAGDQTGGSTYDVIADSLRQAREIDDAKKLHERLSGLNRFICDQGPLSDEFLPTLTSLFLRLHELYGHDAA